MRDSEREEASINDILSHYPHASAIQRWHLRGRLRLCPYEPLLRHLTREDTLLDIGCGFGHLAWFLAARRPSLQYFGTDIDARKIALAVACPNSRTAKPVFKHGNVQDMKDLPERFGNIVLLDVLCLVPWELQQSLLAWALERLSSSGALVIRSVDPSQGLTEWRAVIQEAIMVHVLGRTRSSGTLWGAMPPSRYRNFAEARGFRCDVEDLPAYNPSYFLRIAR